ncbi:MAG: DUF655 domain-containing protein [Candidatus Micrarchaeia archaeon]|jgi:putative nucleotide binding protein
MKREEHALVLDFLPYGRSTAAQGEPIAQVVGDAYFTLLELVLKRDAKVAAGEKLYIGPGEREKIDHIAGRISYNQLTSSAQKELEHAVRVIVKAREADFVNFFNRAGPISIRAHTLELLPSIGKKHLKAILDERQKKPFTSFQDIRERLSTLGNVEDIFVNRILEEVRGDSKYYFFVKPMRSAEER